MDFEDSRDSSSENESDNNSVQSPSSQRSRSRSPRPKSQNSGFEEGLSHSPRNRSNSETRLDGLKSSPDRNSKHSRSSSSLSVESSEDTQPGKVPKSPIGNGPPDSPARSNSADSLKPPVEKYHNSDSEDNQSVKSGSSRSSRKSRSRSSSRSSSRGSRRSKKSDRDSSSDSSVSSVDSSSRKNKNINKTGSTQPEDVSDGDMESDNASRNKTASPVRRTEINISHEDLSDVSDLEDSIGHTSDDENVANKEIKLEDRVSENKDGDNALQVESSEKKENKDRKLSERSVPPNRAEEGEEQLDFEAEDGECADIDQPDETNDKKSTDEGRKPEKPKEELEEGEVTDEDDVRPEETEPRPVCRFFSRGQCTWGASCRFLHPGVTDKGNYTMFDMVRPLVPGEFGVGGRMVDERMYGKVETPLIESAWERGLRTAKEMLRKSMKRKEQDIDFEEKKMNLSIAQEEFDKENGYYGRVPSPEPRYVRHIAEYPVSRPQPPEDYYSRRQVLYESEYVPPPRREHNRPYREVPQHRGLPPDYYAPKYEEEPPPAAHGTSTSRRKPKREVIDVPVQRAPEERQSNRGDEWSDPWMRSKSPGRRRNRKRSYSSGSSSYSSSSSRSSSASSKSSYRSRSRSLHRGQSSRSRRGRQVSPSVIVSERKAANERAALMNPPAPKRRVPSPGMMRVTGAANPPAPAREDAFGRNRSKLAVAAALARVKGQGRLRSSRSSSGSSSVSSSDSDSSESSSSSSRSTTPAVGPRKASDIVKAMDALKSNTLEKSKIKLNLKNPVGLRKPDIAEARKIESAMVKKRAANSPPPNDPKSKKATSRREELLKQLKAVEDAIAKKRSKV